MELITDVKPTGGYGHHAWKRVTIASSIDEENSKGGAEVAISVPEETVVTSEHSYCN